MRFLRRYQNYRVESATLQKQMPTVGRGKRSLRLAEIARLLVGLNQFACIIVNARSIPCLSLRAPDFVNVLNRFHCEREPRKNHNGVPCGYKGQGVSPRYRSVNKYHTTNSIHAGLSQANWLGIGIARTHFCSGGNTRPARLSGVRGGNFLIKRLFWGDWRE